MLKLANVDLPKAIIICPLNHVDVLEVKIALKLADWRSTQG